MKRNTLNFLIDAVSATVMATMIATGLVIRFVLPPGSGSRRQLWGMGRHDWGDVHFWVAVAAGAVVVLHVALHWQWVCVTTLRCLPGTGERTSPPSRLRRNVTGAAFLFLLVGLFSAFVWAARFGVKDVRVGGERTSDAARVEPREKEPHGRQGQAHAIRGSTTLREAANQCGITVEQARARLGLPADASVDRRLGQLAAEHGFTLSQAREKLSRAVRISLLEFPTPVGASPNSNATALR